MATLLLKSTWPKFSDFLKKWHFSRSNCIYTRFFSPSSKLAPQCIDPWAKFQPNWTKDKGSRILTSNNNGNCLMTSYIFDRDDVIKIFMFLSQSTIMPSLVVIGPQIKEKHMGPPYSLYFNQKSSARISSISITGIECLGEKFSSVTLIAPHAKFSHFYCKIKSHIRFSLFCPFCATLAPQTFTCHQFYENQEDVESDVKTTVFLLWMSDTKITCFLFATICYKGYSDVNIYFQ